MIAGRSSRNVDAEQFIDWGPRVVDAPDAGVWIRP